MVPVQRDDDDAKLHTDQHRIWKQRRHLAGSRIGGDVIVVRVTTHLQIAYTAADPVRGEPMIAQPARDLDGAIPQGERAHGRVPVPAASCVRSAVVASFSWTSRGP